MEERMRCPWWGQCWLSGTPGPRDHQGMDEVILSTEDPKTKTFTQRGKERQRPTPRVGKESTEDPKTKTCTQSGEGQAKTYTHSGEGKTKTYTRSGEGQP